MDQESLETFLSLAEELKLEGLTSSSTETNRKEVRGKEDAIEKYIKKKENILRKQLLVKQSPWI